MPSLPYVPHAEVPLTLAAICGVLLSLAEVIASSHSSPLSLAFLILIQAFCPIPFFNVT